MYSHAQLLTDVFTMFLIWIALRLFTQIMHKLHILYCISFSRFTQSDVETMQFILRFSSSMLSNTLLFQHELALKQQNQALLQVARTLFTSLG